MMPKEGSQEFRDLTNLTRFPEFSRPMPVDSVIRDPANLAAQAAGRPILGAGGRFHIGVLRHHRGDFDLVDYGRDPWAVLKTQWRNCMKRALIYDFTSSIENDQTYQDDTGTNRTMRPATNSATMNSGSSLLADGLHAVLRYGSGVTAPAPTDFNIQTQLGADINGAAQYNDTAHTSIITGSRQHTEAGATANEKAYLNRYVDTGTVRRLFLVDRSAESPGKVIATNDIVALAFEAQF